jgi:hypothetical protein
LILGSPRSLCRPPLFHSWAGDGAGGQAQAVVTDILTNTHSKRRGEVQILPSA